MGNETRATMIEGAIQLLATLGVHGASLLKVLEHTGAPRGSVYHHFPGGKEELILTALDLTGQRHDRFVDRFRGTSAEEITAGYLELWRRILVRSRLESGCPILAVTVSVSAGPLLDRAGEIFRTSQRHLVDLYEEVGVLRSAAERFVIFLVASAEGAVVLARAQQDIEPFEVVADQLIEQAAAMPTVVSTTADHQAPATSTRVKRAPTGGLLRSKGSSSPQRRSSVRVHRSTAPGAQHSSLSRSCRSRRWQVRTSNGGRRAACFTERSTYPAYLSRAHPVSLPRSYHLCRRSRASCTSTQFLHALPVSVGWRLGFLLVPALALVGGRRGEDMPGPSSEPRPIALRHRAEAGDVRRPTAVMAGAEARPAASSAPRLWSGRTRRRRWRGAVGAGRGLGTRSTRS